MKHPRTILITGGGTGIGLAMAKRFVEAGDQVIVVGRREPVLQEAARQFNQKRQDGLEVDYVATDLSSPKGVSALRQVLEEKGIKCIDVLINNAGGSIQRQGDSLDDIAEQFTNNFQANLLSAVLTTEALKDMLASPDGRVINLSSIGALKGGGAAYSAAKAGVIGYSYALANELGSKQVTVNVIAPGYVSDTEFFGDTLTQERHESLVAQTLLKRPGMPQDIAGMAFFLASEEAGYVTGQVLQVHGGALVR